MHLQKIGQKLIAINHMQIMPTEANILVLQLFADCRVLRRAAITMLFLVLRAFSSPSANAAESITANRGNGVDVYLRISDAQVLAKGSPSGFNLDSTIKIGKQLRQVIRQSFTVASQNISTVTTAQFRLIQPLDTECLSNFQSMS